MRHSWTAPSRTLHRTERTCRNCGLMRVTHLDGFPPQTTWWRPDGVQIVMSSGTPECEPAEAEAETA